MSQVVNITQEQAEAILQIRLLHPDIGFAKEWTVMCRGYGADNDTSDRLEEDDPDYFNSNDFTGLEPEDIEDDDLSAYWDFQLWRNTAREGKGGK